MTLHLVIAFEFAVERTSCGPKRLVAWRGWRITNTILWRVPALPFPSSFSPLLSFTVLHFFFSSIQSFQPLLFLPCCCFPLSSYFFSSILCFPVYHLFLSHPPSCWPPALHFFPPHLAALRFLFIFSYPMTSCLSLPISPHKAFFFSLFFFLFYFLPFTVFPMFLLPCGLRPLLNFFSYSVAFASHSLAFIPSLRLPAW